MFPDTTPIFRRGTRFKVYHNGEVYLLKSDEEIGYLENSQVEKVFKEKYSGISLDMYVKDNLNVPSMLIHKVDEIFNELENNKCYKSLMTTINVAILKEFLSATELDSLLMQYKQHIKNKKLGIEDIRIAEMYTEYIDGAPLDEIAKRYNYKQIGRVEMMIAKYALKLQRKGITAEEEKKKLEQLHVDGVSKEDVKKYYMLLKDNAGQVVKRIVCDNELPKSVAKTLGLNISYIYALKSKGLKEIAKYTKEEVILKRT